MGCGKGVCEEEKGEFLGKKKNECKDVKKTACSTSKGKQAKENRDGKKKKGERNKSGGEKVSVL